MENREWTLSLGAFCAAAIADTHENHHEQAACIGRTRSNRQRRGPYMLTVSLFLGSFLVSKLVCPGGGTCASSCMYTVWTWPDGTSNGAPTLNETRTTNSNQAILGSTLSVRPSRAVHFCSLQLAAKKLHARLPAIGLSLYTISAMNLHQVQCQTNTTKMAALLGMNKGRTIGVSCVLVSQHQLWVPDRVSVAISAFKRTCN